MADQTLDDSTESQPDVPRRTTLKGRRFGYVNFPAEQLAEEPELTEWRSVRRDTGERHCAT
jgi:hypothetical protein